MCARLLCHVTQIPAILTDQSLLTLSLSSVVFVRAVQLFRAEPKTFYLRPSNLSKPSATLNSELSATVHDTGIAQTTAATSSSVATVEDTETESVSNNV